MKLTAKVALLVAFAVAVVDEAVCSLAFWIISAAVSVTVPPSSEMISILFVPVEKKMLHLSNPLKKF